MTKCCLILLCLSASCFMWSEASPFFFNIQKSYVSQPSRGNSQTTVSQNTDFGLGSVVSKWLALSQIFTDKVFGTTQRPRAIQRPVVQVDSVYTAEELSETTTNAPTEKEVKEETAAPTTRMPTTSMLMTKGTTAKSAMEIVSNEGELPNRIMTEATTEGTTAQTGMDILANEYEPTTKLMTKGTTAKTGMDILSNGNKPTKGTTPVTPIESLSNDDYPELSKEELPDEEDITTSKTTTVSFSAGAVTDKIFSTTQRALNNMGATSMLPKTTTKVPAMIGGSLTKEDTQMPAERNNGKPTKTESVGDAEASIDDLPEDADITAAKSAIDNIASLIEKDSAPKPLSNATDTEASIEDLTEDADITAAKSAIDNIASSFEKDSSQKPLSNAGDTEASIEDLTEDADITAAKPAIDNIASSIEKDSAQKPLSNAADTEASIEDLTKDADITAANSAIDNIASSIKKDSTPGNDKPLITLMGRFPTGRKRLPTLRATTYKPFPTRDINGYQYTKPANQLVRPKPTILSQQINPPTSTRFSQDGISSRAEPRPFDVLSVNGRSDNFGGGGFKGADTRYDAETDGIDPRLYYFIY